MIPLLPIRTWKRITTGWLGAKKMRSKRSRCPARASPVGGAGFSCPRAAETVMRQATARTTVTVPRLWWWMNDGINRSHWDNTGDRNGPVYCGRSPCPNPKFNAVVLQCLVSRRLAIDPAGQRTSDQQSEHDADESACGNVGGRMNSQQVPGPSHQDCPGQKCPGHPGGASTQSKADQGESRGQGEAGQRVS